MKFLLPLLLVTLITQNTVISQEDEEYERIAVELQLEDFDLGDAHDQVSKATKNAILGHGYDEKISAEADRAKLMRIQSQRNLELENDVPFDLQRNWTLLTKTGDFLLPEAEYYSLIKFHNANEELSNQTKVPCLNGSSGCMITKQGFLDLLTTNRNTSYLNQTWAAWQENLLANKANFSSVLQLVNKAYLTNEDHSARSYWETLSEYQDGYTQAQTLWEEIRPLYKKLHDFVKVRLYNYYKVAQNVTEIPIYLLGSNFGNDWSNIADIVLPHPYLYHEVLSELKHHTVKEIYQLAESTTKSIGLGHLGKRFWGKSDFNSSSCGPHLFSSCEQDYTEVLTCKKLGWTEYLDIHEAAIDVALRNLDYISLPRQQVRFSAADEALKGLGSLIAINNLPVYDFIPQNAFKDEKDTYDRKNTALLLTALRILPKIPYYLLADTWRLEELEFSYGNFTDNWWEKRKEMQGVWGNTGLEPDFLGDSAITSNKPLLSKFFGNFLQFQLLDYYQKFYSTDNGTIANFLARDENFIPFVKDRSTKDWQYLISFHFGFDQVSSTALLEYFKPLEEYLEKAPLKQVIFSTTPKPRTTKATSKPTPRNPKLYRPLFNSTTVNETKPLKPSNETRKKMRKVEVPAVAENSSEMPKTNTASSEKLYVLGGIFGVVCVGVLIVMVVRRLRRKQRTNNRRYET